jgi:Glu-tRNA(Gln) amidotransferase subunit E-like FAD-binding protein
MSVRSFRHQQTKRTPQPSADALRASRKLSRAMRGLDVSSLAAADAKILRRSLLRATRGIAATLERLDAVIGQESQPSRDRPAEPAAPLRVAASGGVSRIPAIWQEKSAAERFRRSS